MNLHVADAPESAPINEKDQTRLWASFSVAVGTELRPAKSIRGISGLEHPVQAIAVDDKRKRVLIVSAEQNARVAALMQVDVQSTMPDVRVLVARPVVLDLGVIARNVFRNVEDARININEFKSRMERFQKLEPARSQRYVNRQLNRVVQPAVLAFKHVTLPTLNQIMDVIQQAANLDWSGIFENLTNGNDDPTISFERLLQIDNTAIDREYGVCPVPLYEFSPVDWELFLRGDRPDEIRRRLRELDIYQYFFPAPDQVALGVTDKGLTVREDIIRAVTECQRMGHPLGDSEIVPAITSIPDLLGALGEMGYLAEGEHGVEISPIGHTTRMVLKYRPRESLISKLINRFTVNANLSASIKDLLPPT
ncbi:MULTISPECIES: hypothetical protein [unclassified Bradyrhizobium]|uniref:hypothetical protein n=1 Tax=unclassified Bradyrhizobium TaxID=2631580 RepID=UPI0028ED5802|nr:MULTISPECIES: hypothetical protein [unclassified Bradyrhizobium]